MDISDLIKKLSEPSCYPHSVEAPIKVLQTQMSVIFITGEYVYKIKKPVNLGYLDYSPLENRKFFCNQEILLNRRLSPDVYLEVLPITEEALGEIAFNGNGTIVDYAIKMRYLPQDRMLDKLLLKDAVTPTMMQNVAKFVASFHKKAETSEEISAIASFDTQSYNAEENFTQLQPYIDRVLKQSQHSRIATFGRTFLKENKALIDKRINEGKIRDCHGDLHSQHICFTDPISIYDCIDFTNRFRCIDIAAEVSFLCMDLDHNGYGNLAQVFLNQYITESQDPEIIKLTRYYKSYYACVRAKVNCFQLDDPLLDDTTKTKCLKTAQSYLNLADSNARNKQIIFVNCGTSGSGKTTISKELAKQMGLYYISSDIIRKEITHTPLYEHNNKEIYNSNISEQVYSIMLTKAEDAIKLKYSVILDATYLTKDGRNQVKELAKRLDCDFYILHHTIDEDTTKKFLTQREQEGTVSDATFDIYLKQINNMEMPDDSDSSVIHLDAIKSIDEKITIILDMVNNG